MSEKKISHEMFEHILVQWAEGALSATQGAENNVRDTVLKARIDRNEKQGFRQKFNNAAFIYTCYALAWVKAPRRMSDNRLFNAWRQVWVDDNYGLSWTRLAKLMKGDAKEQNKSAEDLAQLYPKDLEPYFESFQSYLTQFSQRHPSEEISFLVESCAKRQSSSAPQSPKPPKK